MQSRALGSSRFFNGTRSVCLAMSSDSSCTMHNVSGTLGYNSKCTEKAEFENNKGGTGGLRLCSFRNLSE